MAGKRKRYLNPARLFLFSMLFHFGVLAYISNQSNTEINIGGGIGAKELSKNVTTSTLLHQFDSLVSAIPVDTTAAVDTLRKRLFVKVIDNEMDSISFGDNDGVSGTGDLFRHKYAFDDIINMKEADFLTHYQIEGFWRRTVTRQGIRLYRNPKAVYSFFLGNLVWAVVLSLLFLSFVLKLLYWRSKRFYVEHLILMMHVHAFVFIMVGMALLVDSWSGNAIGEWLWSTAGIAAIYFFVSMYSYYQQGLIKTFFKYLFLMFSYILIISIFAVFILFISLLVF